MDTMQEMEQAIRDSLLRYIPAVDPVSGQMVNRLDLRERERKAHSILDSLPPRQLEAVRKEFEDELAGLLKNLAGCECVVTIAKLPSNLATGKVTADAVLVAIHDRILLPGQREPIDEQLEILWKILDPDDDGDDD